MDETTKGTQIGGDGWLNQICKQMKQSRVQKTIKTTRGIWTRGVVWIGIIHIKKMINIARNN
jgi:hypothetical protein